MRLRLSFRELDVTDLDDLDWSGGAEHLRAVAEALQASFAGDVAAVVGSLDNGRLVALGAVDFRPMAGSGLIWMLAVHERFQSLGIGSALVSRLEAAVVVRGWHRARLLVELDNPRARALYARLGYREVGAALDSWPVAAGQTHVAACTIMERVL